MVISLGGCGVQVRLIVVIIMMKASTFAPFGVRFGIGKVILLFESRDTSAKVFIHDFTCVTVTFLS